MLLLLGFLLFLIVLHREYLPVYIINLFNMDYLDEFFQLVIFVLYLKLEFLNSLFCFLELLDLLYFKEQLIRLQK